MSPSLKARMIISGAMFTSSRMLSLQLTANAERSPMQLPTRHVDGDFGYFLTVSLKYLKTDGYVSTNKRKRKILGLQRNIIMTYETKAAIWCKQARALSRAQLGVVEEL